MSNGKIRLKKLSDLMQEAEAPVKSKTKTPKWKCKTVPESSSVLLSDNDSDFVETNATPKRVKKQKELRGAPTTSKKTIEQPKTSKKIPKSNKKELAEGQTKIDSFFKSCSKSYQVEEKTNSNWQARGNQTTGGKLQKNKGKTVKNMGRGRKRLFDDTTESDTDATTAPGCISGMTLKKPARKRSVKTSEKNNLLKEKPSIVACIDLISESEEENGKETEDAIEKIQPKSAAEIVMQVNNANSKETPPMVHVNSSEEVTCLAVRNDICTSQTHAIYLGNKPLQTDIGMLTLSDPRTISNVMQHESSEVEDIGTLIQQEEEKELVIDEKTPPSFYVNNSNAELQTLDKTDQQLLSCHTMNNSLADLRATKSVIQQQSSEIEETSILIQKEELTETLLWSSQTNNLTLVDLEVSSSVIKQQSSELEGIDHLIQKEEKETTQAYVNNTEILQQDSTEHQQSSFHMNKPTNSDIEPTNSVNQSSEVEDIGILIQVEKEEYMLKSQSILSIKCSIEERDAKQNKESYLTISDDENSLLPDENSLQPKSRCQRTTNNLKQKDELNVHEDVEPLHSKKDSISFPEKINSEKVSIPQLNSKNMSQEEQIPETEEVVIFNTTPEEERTKANTKKRKPRPCPPYKIVQGTTFAVDAFQFGLIKGVTHYFLTHFHADHYIGLTRKFSMQLFCSPVTARLLRVFIPLEESYIQEIELNKPQVIEGVEVTAIDANHCPGAVMFVFKLPTGKCILHTGDFRASPNMESEPIFWNNDIHTIYLDTTYISNKYAFCSQDESIDKAQHLIEQFQEKHKDKKILYLCGAYLIGKERIWSSIARNNRLFVWTDVRRNKALRAMQDLDHLELLCANPISATMHLIPMGKLSYFSLVEYFEPFSSRFDICLAIRPSGWEKNSKPQYRGKINIIGVEYSEHSSYNELQRFVTYLNPQEVISTVPVSSNLMVTSEVPQAWYKYKKFPTQHRNFQPSITNYLKRKTKNVSSSEQNEDSSKENFLPNQLSQSDEYEDVKCSQKVLTDKLSLLHAADDADDDWLS